MQAYVDDACGREGTKKTHGSNLEFPERKETKMRGRERQMGTGVLALSLPALGRRNMNGIMTSLCQERQLLKRVGKKKIA